MRVDCVGLEVEQAPCVVATVLADPRVVVFGQVDSFGLRALRCGPRVPKGRPRFAGVSVIVECPDLNLAQVHSALAYYYDHQDEIDAELARDEGADERYERRRAEDLTRHRGR